MNNENKSITLLFNPFVYVAGGVAFAIGMAVILLASFIGSLSNTHFDGVLDSHTGSSAPLWFFLSEGIIDWVCLSIVLLVIGRIISRTSFRTIDLVGTQALARWPSLIISIAVLPPAFGRFSKQLAEQILHGSKPTFNTVDALIFFTIVILMIPLVCWMVYLMYKAFSVSCNVKGGKAIGTFIVGLIVAEILSKLCLVPLVGYARRLEVAANASVVQPVIATQTAVAPVAAPSNDLITLATKLTDSLAREDFEGAEALFDDTMKSALPTATLRTVWEGTLKEVGAFKKQVGTRLDNQAGYDMVFVTCQLERATLDLKVVFDSEKRVAGLFFVPTQPAAGSKPASYVNPDRFREKDFRVSTGNWHMPGTLTLPVGAKNPLPAVVLVHGSGPNDRDETILANKPFRDLAWGLAAKGIAVLRYEKRTKEYAARYAISGIGNLTVKEETIDDALSAVAQLRRTDGIDPKRIFVLGHSLGGCVAPRIGQGDPELAGLIILAGSTRPLEDIVVEQARYLLSLTPNASEQDRAKLDQLVAIATKVKKLTASDADSSELLLNAPARYWLDLREHDPLATAKMLKQPLLIFQGGRDYQVTEADFNGWKGGLQSQPNVTFKLYAKLNHLFMAGEGKSTPAEYERPGHVAEDVIADIAEWILNNSH